MDYSIEKLIYATTCAKGCFYNKYKTSPFDVEQLKYTDKEIVLRAYGEKGDLTFVFDIYSNKFSNIIDNSKNKNIKFKVIDDKNSIFDLSNLIGLLKENDNEIKFIIKDNKSLNGIFTYINKYENKELRDKWFDKLKSDLTGV